MYDSEQMKDGGGNKKNAKIFPCVLSAIIYKWDGGKFKMGICSSRNR